MHLEMLPEAGGVGVGLVTTPHSAVVRFVRGVDMHVLLAIAGVGESSVATLHLTFKRLFSWNRRNVSNVVRILMN